MNWIALKMLTGDYVKYIGMIFGVAFSTLLITQQSSIFLGLVNRAASTVSDVREADVWVMDTRIEAVDSVWPIPDTALQRVRGVEGVAWAAPFLRATTTIVAADLPLQTASLFGLDDATLVGLPSKIISGRREDLAAPGTVMMDEGGWQFLFPGQPFAPGKRLELNDRRAVVVGLVQAGVQFSSQVSIYTRYSAALGYAPGGRKRLTFVIAKSAPGYPASKVASNITKATGLKAMDSTSFAKASSDYVIYNTGIPISFGTVVFLGVIVGIVVVALTFTLFIRDNIKQFASLKAIGLSSPRLIGMVLLQGSVVGAMGYGLGLGAATALVNLGAQNSLALRGFYVPWTVAVFAAVVVVLIISAAGLIAIRKVLITDPATVFRG
jgi:putative ABC transport system permease protein